MGSLVQCIAVNIGALAIFKNVLDVVSFGSETHVTPNKHAVYCMSKISWLKLIRCMVNIVSDCLQFEGY